MAQHTDGDRIATSASAQTGAPVHAVSRRKDVASVVVYPHLPKTAGRTLVAHLQRDRNEGYDFFHLAPKGRSRQSIRWQYETAETSETSELGKNLVLFGHQADEGLLLDFSPDTPVRLGTTLRHPLKRVISHFNHKRSMGAFSGSLDEYIGLQMDPMCRWYVRMFPSFIRDPFQPLYHQARDVLTQFSNILIQEHAEKDFPDFLQLIGSQYTADLSNNRAGVDYDFASRDESLDVARTERFLRQDLNLYADFAHNGANGAPRLRSDLPEIRSYHRWWAPFLNTFHAQDDEETHRCMRASVGSNPVLTEAMQEEQSGTTLERAMRSMLAHIEWIEEDPQHLANALDLLDANGLSSRPQHGSGPLARLLQEAWSRGAPKDLSKVCSAAWLELPACHPRIALGRAAYHEHGGDLDAAESELRDACRLLPTGTLPFVQLGKLAQKRNDHELALACAEKVIELNPAARWPNSVLKTYL